MSKEKTGEEFRRPSVKLVPGKLYTCGDFWYWYKKKKIYPNEATRHTNWRMPLMFIKQEEIGPDEALGILDKEQYLRVWFLFPDGIRRNCIVHKIDMWFDEAEAE